MTGKDQLEVGGLGQKWSTICIFSLFSSRLQFCVNMREKSWSVIHTLISFSFDLVYFLVAQQTSELAQMFTMLWNFLWCNSKSVKVRFRLKMQGWVFWEWNCRKSNDGERRGWVCVFNSLLRKRIHGKIPPPRHGTALNCNANHHGTAPQGITRSTLSQCTAQYSTAPGCVRVQSMLCETKWEIPQH